jgi:DNA-binding HxlR family transcriptional regulator
MSFGIHVCEVSKMKMRQEYTCPLEIVHDIVKGKWKTIIVFQLRKGNKSFSELEHEIEGVSQKMLLQQLKELREFNLIDKISTDGYPLHVEYFLTERGKKLLQAVEIMQEIGIEYMIEHGQTDILDRKGICCYKDISTKK